MISGGKPLVVVHGPDHVLKLSKDKLLLDYNII